MRNFAGEPEAVDGGLYEQRLAAAQGNAAANDELGVAFDAFILHTFSIPQAGPFFVLGDFLRINPERPQQRVASSAPTRRQRNIESNANS